jgi:hypothetical protein
MKNKHFCFQCFGFVVLLGTALHPARETKKIFDANVEVLYPYQESSTIEREGNVG